MERDATMHSWSVERAASTVSLVGMQGDLHALRTAAEEGQHTAAAQQRQQQGAVEAVADGLAAVQAQVAGGLEQQHQQDSTAAELAVLRGQLGTRLVCL